MDIWNFRLRTDTNTLDALRKEFEFEVKGFIYIKAALDSETFEEYYNKISKLNDKVPPLSKFRAYLLLG